MVKLMKKGLELLVKPEEKNYAELDFVWAEDHEVDGYIKNGYVTMQFYKHMEKHFNVR